MSRAFNNCEQHIDDVKSKVAILLIPKNFIQDLLNRLDIVNVVERYVPLKKVMGY